MTGYSSHMSSARDATAWLRTPLVRRGESVLAWGEPTALASRLLARDVAAPVPRPVAGEAVAPRTVTTKRRMGLPEIPAPAPLLVRQQPKKLTGDAAAAFRRAQTRGTREPIPERATIAACVSQAGAERTLAPRPVPVVLDPARERTGHPRGLRAARRAAIDPANPVLGSAA